MNQMNNNLNDLTQSEVQLIKMYRLLNEDGRRNVQDQASLLIASGLYSKVRKANNPNLKRVK